MAAHTAAAAAANAAQAAKSAVDTAVAQVAIAAAAKAAVAQAAAVQGLHRQQPSRLLQVCHPVDQLCHIAGAVPSCCCVEALDLLKSRKNTKYSLKCF